jgi:hypothetical protein
MTYQPREPILCTITILMIKLQDHSLLRATMQAKIGEKYMQDSQQLDNLN